MISQGDQGDETERLASTRTKKNKRPNKKTSQ